MIIVYKTMLYIIYYYQTLPTCTNMKQTIPNYIIVKANYNIL